MKLRNLMTKTLALLFVMLFVFSSVQPAMAADASISLKANTPYTIVCTSNGLNVNMDCAKPSQIKNKTAVNLYKASGDDTQRFTFTAKNGAYRMDPCGVSGYTVNINYVKAGAKVYAWKAASFTDEYWIIQKVSGGYTFRLKSNTSLYLTASGSTLTLAKYSGAKTQIFTIAEVKANSSNGNKQPTSNVTLKAGTAYCLTNGGKYVNMNCQKPSQIKNKTAVNLYAASYDQTQQFTFTAKNGAYRMDPCGVSGYTVNIDYAKAGAKVYAWKAASSTDEYWIVESTSGGYTLRLKSAPDLYLTAKGSTLTLAAKSTSGSTQVFNIVQASSVKKPTTSTSSSSTTNSNKSVTLNVPTLRQTDSRWKNKLYCSNKEATIGKYGCMLTCVTAVMSCVDGKTYRPDEYCKKLSFNSSACMYSVKNWKWGQAYSLATLKAQLDKGNPVMVGGKGSKGQHYVVVYGYTNGGQTAADFKVMDPGTAKVTTLSQHIANYGRSMYYYNK